MISQNTILAECETVNILARHLTTHLMSLQNGIYDLLKNKLSPSLVNLETISNTLAKAEIMISKRGYQYAISSATDVYQLETNFVVADNKIYILSHVPLLRNAGLIDLHKYISTPILLTNSTRQIVIKPPQTIVGLSPDRSRFVSMTESDLLSCKHLHNEFWCIDNQIAKKISHNSCVKSLFEKNLKDILEQCPITTVTPQEYLLPSSRAPKQTFQ